MELSLNHKMTLVKEKELIKKGLMALKDLGNFENLLESPLPPQISELASSRSLKSIEAEHYRLKGNELFTKNDHDICTHYEIINYYNTSIAASPLNSEIQALAYGNRSAILEHIGRYNESIIAIDRALKITQSLPLKIKLLCRKAKCAAALGLSNEMKYLVQAKSLLDKISEVDESKKTLTDFISKTEVIVEDKIQNPSTMNETPNDGDELISKIEADSSSSAVEIAQSEKYGRHLIAARDIKIGEILMSEKTLNSAPYSGRMNLHCWHCSSFLWDIIPCDFCVVSCFCSEQCKAESWEKYHEVECKILPTLIFDYQRLRSCHDASLKVRSSISNQLGLRIFLTALKQSRNVHNLKAIFDSFDECEDEYCTLRDQGRMGDFPIDEYRQIYDLHISVRLDDIDELVQDSAIHLVICAKHTSIFKKIFDPDTVTVEKLMNNDDMIFMGALLLRFCIVAEYHSLTSVRRPECEKEKPCDVDGYGSISSSFGVRTSFASHSCIPNANKCMIKSNQVILYSILPIKKGSRICDSLSPSVFSGAPKRERQKYFEQHHGFSCDCQACQEDWPDIVYEDDILEYFSGVAPTLSGRTLEIVEKFRHELNLAYASDDSSPMEMLTKFSKLIQDSLDESPLPAKLTAFMIRWFAVLFDYTQGFPNRSRVSDECPS